MIGPRGLRSPLRGPREFQGFSGAVKLVLRPRDRIRGSDRSAVASRIRPLPARRPEAAGLEGGRAARGAAEGRRAPRRARRRGRRGRAEGGAAPRVWPDTFVEEANLSVNVSILRKALGEQPDGRPWIQTVARRGYRFLGAVRAQAAAPRSLAVLPFRSLGTDEADDALGLGMADALITRLAATGRVAVRPTGTVRRFASPDVDPVEAGRQLGVDAVVDGRLQRSGSRLRLTVQLVPTAGGAPLWADHFDEEFTHLFAVEDTVAERVAAALVAELSTEERQRLGRRQTESLEAYQAYCRGRFFWGRFSRPWVEKAMLSFHEATAHDPRYALPHAGLADAFLVAGFAGASPAARGLGPRGGVVPAGPGPRRPDPGAPRLGGLPPPPAGLGLGRRRARAAARHRAGARLRRSSPVARPRPRPSRPRGRSGPRAAAGRRAGPAVAGRLGPRRPAPRVRRRARGRARPGPAHARARPAPVPRPLGGGERPAEPRAPRRGGGGAPPGAGPGRGHGLHEARSRPQPGPRRPGGRGAGAPGPGGAGRRPHPTRRRPSTSRWARRTARSSSWPRRRTQRDPWIVLLAVDPLMRALRGHPAFEELVRECARADARHGTGLAEAFEIPRVLRSTAEHARGYPAPPPPFDSSAPIRLAFR